jgi:hypothetical protein
MVLLISKKKQLYYLSAPKTKRLNTSTRQWFPDIDHFYYLHKHLGHKLIQQPCTVLRGAFFLGILLKRIHDSSLQYHKNKLESRSKMRDCFLACHGNLLLPGRVQNKCLCKPFCFPLDHIYSDINDRGQQKYLETHTAIQAN